MWLATGFTIDSRVVTRQIEAHVLSMQDDKESRQLDHYKTKKYSLA